jgi:hypothetical protein
MSISQLSSDPPLNPEERRRRPKAEVKAPVREERTIGEILESLVGAPREAWLNKWRRWIAELIDNYDLEDPQEIGYDETKIEDFLEEHCIDLTESECYAKIKQMVIEKSAKTFTQDVADSFTAWFEYVKKDPSFLCTQYNLSPDVCSDVLKVAKNPCLDRKTAEKILRAFFEAEIKKMGGEPSEELYKDALNDILKIIPEAKCIDWQQVLVAQRAYHNSVVRRMWRQRKLDEYFGMVRFKEVSVSEMAKLLNAQVYKITKAKTVDEARELVVKWCKEKRYKLVEVRPPVELEFFKEGLVYYIEPEPKCLLEVKAVEKPATPKAEYYILRTCGGRVMLASNVDSTWYVAVV